MATAAERPRPATKPPIARHPKAWAGEDRFRMIAEAAYFRAEQRGFIPGNELADWLEAELEVDDVLAAAGGPEEG